MSYDDGQFSNYESAVSLLGASGSLSSLPDPRMSYLAAMQAITNSVLAVADELKALNSGRDQFHREVLDVLSAAKSGDVSLLRSERPAAAGVCRACGRATALVDLLCDEGPLSYAQWFSHRDEVVRDLGLKGVERMESIIRANKETYDRFGPCPEES